MSVTAYVAALLGCGLGAMVRYSLGWLDRSKRFPWPTIVANILGATLLGGVAAAASAGSLGTAAAFALGTGVAGGLSTFSSLAVDALVLWKDSRRGAASGYLLLTLTLGIAAAGAGYGVVTAAL